MRLISYSRSRRVSRSKRRSSKCLFGLGWLPLALKDGDAYVRKTAAIAVAKLFDSNPEAVISEGFLDTLREMPTDADADLLRERYGVPVIPLNCLDIEEQDIFLLFQLICH